jgi:hypothetical protein
MFIAFNNLKIVSKTHNQPEIKILFGFKSTIPDKFKGKTTPCLNSTHQTEPIETKITYFCGQNRSQPRLSLSTTRIWPLSLLFFKPETKKKKNMKFWTKIKFYKLLGTEAYNLKSLRTKVYVLPQF